MKHGTQTETKMDMEYPMNLCTNTPYTITNREFVQYSCPRVTNRDDTFVESFLITFN